MLGQPLQHGSKDTEARLWSFVRFMMHVRCLLYPVFMMFLRDISFAICGRHNYQGQ